jgi:hypothetical protein
VTEGGTVTAKKADTADVITEADTDKEPADWPTAPLVVTVPSFDGQPGDRLTIRTNVSIFGLAAQTKAVVFDNPEVHAAADSGLVEILKG